MSFLNQLRGPRRLVCLSLICVGLALAGCADEQNTTATGSPFSQALFKNYVDLATQAGAAPPPQSTNNDNGFFDDLLSVFESGPNNPAEAVADAFQAKAETAASGAELEPEIAPADPTAQNLRARLMRALAQGRSRFPQRAARAQADYDCWILDSSASNLIQYARACRTSLNSSLLALENAVLPAPPPPPPPPPVKAAPAPAAQLAPANYTVYFDFDSWTLTAEDLAVITNVINTARAGGQSHIIVVGHTDTAGPAAYNQRLSVRRANVVVEALVDMGARRAAIQASGVGETDLAVQTGNGVKEAKNRRAVITLKP